MLADAVVLIVVGAVALLLPSYRPYRAYLRRRLVHKAGAQVPADQEAFLESRVAVRAQGGGMGIIVAGLCALLLSRTWAGAEEASGALFVLALMFVAGAAGAVLAELLRPGDAAPGPRTARATSPTVEDYLPPRQRTMARVFVACGVLATVGTLLATATEWFDAGAVLRSPVPVLAVGIPVLALLSWLAARRVLDAPQPARDEAELYWQDAFRAETLSSLSLAAPLVSLLALVVGGSVLDDAASAAAVAAGQTGPAWSLALLIGGYLAPFVLVGVAVLVTSAGGSRTEMEHFRARLWGGRTPAGVTGEA